MDKKMYEINPVVKLPEKLLLSNVMHNVSSHFALPDNIKKTYYENSKPHSFPENAENISELIARQENVLETLKKIKEKLTDLQKQQQKLGLPATISSSKATSKTQIADADFESLKSGVILDIVVYADPANPPYFLLALKNLLNPYLKVGLSSTIHSSAGQVGQNILDLFQDKSFKDRSNFNVVFTVIWKNQKFKSLMVNPFTQSPIIGEGNILRYLSRLFPSLSTLNFECGDLLDVTETDYWLDLIQMKFLHGNNKEQQNVLKQLNSKLGSSDWINGKQLGVCDLFLWSALKQVDPRVSSTLPSNVASWTKKISNIADINMERSECTYHKKKQSEEQNTKKYFSQDDLEKFFKKNLIKFQSKIHKEVFTVDKLMEVVEDMPGIHMKNLFLKDKKNNLYLLCARHDAKVNLKNVANKIGAKELRFADENTLKDVLGVTQGCVTLYALVNDVERRVNVLLDSEVTKHEYVNFHPLVNSATLGISPKDLEKFLQILGHEITLLDI